MEYSRGSEWRRWDLHLHTPETKKNSQFTGKTIPEQWENFYNDILSYIETNDITKKVAVIGITDYFSIDNYRKVISDKKLEGKVELILPNIEMRITPVSNRSAINIHFICNPEIVPQLDTKLFSQLVYQHSNGIKYHATKEDFIKLGRLAQPDIPEEQAYIRGLGQFVVDFTNLKEILNDKELRENTIVALSNSSSDGASGVGNQSCNNVNSDLSTLRDDLYYFTDMIFSANPSTIDYFLGRKPEHPPKEIIEKYGKLIPCIHGCDAHKNSQIFRPDNDRFCWIKADCTFEGLKQIIYEPEERVRIQSTYPELKKNYNLIDKVIITNPDFSTQPILFNENLTCFIGGKSTGKSIILNNMARLIDNEQFLSKCKNNYEIKGMKVYWKDGFISDESSKVRNICYIPQAYLNSLSDKPDEQTEIDTIIESILLQDEKIAEKYKIFKQKLDNTKNELDKEVNDLIREYNLKSEFENSLKETGGVEDIDKEIKKLFKDRDFLLKELQINNEDINQYDHLKTEYIKISSELNIINNDIFNIGNMSVSVDFSQDIDKISNEYKGLAETFLLDSKKRLENEWIAFKKNMIKQASEKRKALNEKEKKLKEALKEKEILIEKTENLKLISSQITIEENKKKYSKELTDALLIHSQNFNKFLQSVIHKLAIFDSIHQEFASYINSRTDDFDETLEFIATAQFKFKKFTEKLKAIYDNRKLKNIVDFNDDGFVNDIDESSLTKLVSPLFSVGTQVLKTNITIEEALRTILANWYNIVYTIKLDNDVISAMSPGKKALVLLKLLINLAKSECPILIDQPEDDLDNRSIFDELVYFLKSKKHNRQIIIVTHNANIVLGSDADEIIVANQNGNNSPNENFRFEYRSGSIENNNVIYDFNGNESKGILKQKGIQDHICEILEGGKEAFKMRTRKYELN